MQSPTATGKREFVKGLGSNLAKRYFIEINTLYLDMEAGLLDFCQLTDVSIFEKGLYVQVELQSPKDSLYLGRTYFVNILFSTYYFQAPKISILDLYHPNIYTEEIATMLKLDDNNFDISSTWLPIYDLRSIIYTVYALFVAIEFDTDCIKNSDAYLWYTEDQDVFAANALTMHQEA